MAQISTFYSFNQTSINFNRLMMYCLGSDSSSSHSNIYWQNGSTYVTNFSGSDFSTSGTSVNGTVTSITEAIYVSGIWEELYVVTGLNLSLASLYSVMLTSSTSDDQSLITAALSGNDTFYLSAFADYAEGLSGNDTMYGYSGADTLVGGADADTLVGGAGKDRVSGGSGSDTFIFESASESSTGSTSADVITDFTKGSDKINLSANDTFVWKGPSAFSSKTQGEVRYEKFDNRGTSNDYTMVWIDTDADKDVEMAIRLTGLYTLSGSDFIL